ncbi:MAG: YkgJ family cysteine cluster protein [Verrucomicrobiaceae bacterium]|nr:YkgJ family cysteine cluster protein [Verrucomicrobiaceae bacterium]
MEEIYYDCQSCGNCCRWPGEVPVGQAEISRMADHLDCTDESFIERFTTLRQSRSGLTLKQHEHGACVLLKSNLCRVHRVKPDQCSGFPNRWQFPGWRQICEAIPRHPGRERP